MRLGIGLGFGSRAAAAAAVTPLPTTGLTGKFEAFSASVTRVNPGTDDHVSGWANDATGGGNLAQATAGAMALYGATALGTKAGITLDGVDDFYTGNAVSNYLSLGAWAVGFAGKIVLSGTNAPASYSNGAILADGAAGNWGLYLKLLNLLGYQWDGGDRHADMAFALNTLVAMLVIFDGTNLKIRKNKGVAGTPTASAVPGAGAFAGNLELGRGSGSSGQSANIIAGGIYTYNVAPSAGNQDAFFDYCNGTWGTGVAG